MKIAMLTLFLGIQVLTLFAGEKEKENENPTAISSDLTLHTVPNDASIELEWTTPAGTEVDYITIERTVDFRTVERVALMIGHPVKKTDDDYHYADRSDYGAVVYYRVRQTLMNGRILTSDWVKAEW